MLREGIKGFQPVYSANSRALILGSYPSPKSFECGFYYGHPQNRFWRLIATLAGVGTPHTIEEKTLLILNNGLALWDSLEHCTIAGAADSTIKNPMPNNIEKLVNKTNIEAVFCNGAQSHNFYTRYCQKKSGIAAVKLPSTSPANAAFSFERLLEEWQPLKQFMSL